MRDPEKSGRLGNDRTSNADIQALTTARLLQRLIRSRRQFLDEFLDGDGPYWVSIGMFINDESDTVTTLEHVLEFADESIETCMYILRSLISRGHVQEYQAEDNVVAYRLTPKFGVYFGRYLRQQFVEVEATCRAIT